LHRAGKCKEERKYSSAWTKRGRVGILGFEWSQKRNWGVLEADYTAGGNAGEDKKLDKSKEKERGQKSRGKTNKRKRGTDWGQFSPSAIVQVREKTYRGEESIGEKGEGKS